VDIATCGFSHTCEPKQPDERACECPLLIGFERREVLCTTHKDQRRKVIEHIGAARRVSGNAC
jgi:hypothetical protein